MAGVRCGTRFGFPPFDQQRVPGGGNVPASRRERKQLGVLVRVRLETKTAEIAPDGEGGIVIDGADPILTRKLSLYIHEKSLYRGSTRGHALRVAKAIAKEFHGTILDLEGLRASLKKDWVRLIKAHLMGDPAQSYGRKRNVFRTREGLALSLVAYRRRKVVSAHASVLIGDPTYLVVHPGDKSPWRVRWEDLLSVQFAYSERSGSQSHFTLTHLR